MDQVTVEDDVSLHVMPAYAGGLYPDQHPPSFEHEDLLVEPSIDNANSAQKGQTSLEPDSGFSRHDSLFSFGVSSSRNAAELKSFLGSSSSRLRPGATVLPLQGCTETGNAVSLEQAKPCARVEVDIVLENDCCVEGGYLRGSVKLRVRKRRKEAHVLLADGKLRVIGFESIPGESNRHAFYQRASPLSAVTDAYNRIYDSPADAEGFSRALEGVHVLPFAMHLPADSQLGTARGSPCLQNGVTLRYIAMISVKVKDSKTGKRSIAHFYRDCQVWPRLDPARVLANAPRPIQASTVGSLAVMGAGSKVRLTAMLPRMTWLAGQRCYVHLSVTNESKKSVKTIKLALIRTTTLFKSRPGLNTSSGDSEPCQVTTIHKVMAEAVLERSQSVAKGHASAPGWWTGVPAGQDAQFAHHILLNVRFLFHLSENLVLMKCFCPYGGAPSPSAATFSSNNYACTRVRSEIEQSDALSVSHARFFEVEYSIQVTLSAGALTSDVQVALPIRIVNFLSLDPLPSAPLLSLDGSYARVVPRDVGGEDDCTSSRLTAGQDDTQGNAAPYDDDSTRRHSQGSFTWPGSKLSRERSVSEVRGEIGGSNPYSLEGADTSTSSVAALHVTNPDLDAQGRCRGARENSELPYESTSDTSLYSAASYASTSAVGSSPLNGPDCPLPLGNLELSDDADTGGDVDVVLQSLTSVHPSDAPGPSEDGIHDGTFNSVRYSQAGNIPTADDGAIPPNSSREASTSSASLRSPPECSDAHRRSCRSHPNPVLGDIFPPPREVRITDRTVAADPAGAPRAASGVDCSVGRPVRPERSPLRARTGTWGPRQQEAAREGLSSFERRVQEKKTALLAAYAGPLPPAPVRLHEPPHSDTRGEHRGYTADVDGDGDDTPRIGTAGRVGPIGCTTIPDDHAAHSASSIRGSRQLPLPPPRPSHVSQRSCDIPTSVSALESLRASQLCSRERLSVNTDSEFLSASADTPTLSSSMAARYSAIPPSLVASTSSSSSSGRSMSCGQQEAFPPSISGLGLYHHRPTEGLRSTGSSDSSIVKGRIAAFEDRLKTSHELGAAYM